MVLIYGLIMFLWDYGELKHGEQQVFKEPMLMKGTVVELSQGEGKQRNGNKEVLEISPISHFCCKYHLL